MGRVSTSALPRLHQADDHVRIDTRSLRPVRWQAEVRLASDRPWTAARTPGLWARLAALLDGPGRGSGNGRPRRAHA